MLLFDLPYSDLSYSDLTSSDLIYFGDTNLVTILTEEKISFSFGCDKFFNILLLRVLVDKNCVNFRV